MAKSILLIGLGRFGIHIAQQLSQRGCEILAVDLNEEKVNAALTWATQAQIGDSRSREFLSSLGIRNFDSCIVAIGEDFQSSLETTDLLRELGARKIIARASTETQEKFLLRIGADEVVFPEKQLASWTAIRCASESVLDFFELGDGYSVYELSAPEDWYGKTVGQLDIRKKYGLTILGVREGDRLRMNVTPETVLGSGSLLVLGQERAVFKCFRV